jgi:hypothetical protein
MSFGGFMGLSHKHYPIPWSALHYDPALSGFRTSVTEQMLKDAPQFSDDSWTDRNSCGPPAPFHSSAPPGGSPSRRAERLPSTVSPSRLPPR